MTTPMITTISPNTTQITNTATIVSTTNTANIVSTTGTTSKSEDIAGLLCTNHPLGMDYRGTLAITSDNQTCQRWDSVRPHYHDYRDVHFPYDSSLSTVENYCRFPLRLGSTDNRPWCYTIDPGERWEYCSIPMCPSSPPTPTTLNNCTTGDMSIHANSTEISMTTIPLLMSTDPIVALCYTVLGGNSIQSPTLTGHKACQSPHSEQTANVILDGNLGSVHLNFGSYDESVRLSTKGIGTGFIVVPQSSGFSVLQTFRFGTGADEPNRDPITITIEGSQFNNNADLQMGSSWNLIYNGWTGINMTNDPGRSVYGDLQTINNTCPYKAYRVLITSQRGPANSVQYSEVQFFGYFID